MSLKKSEDPIIYFTLIDFLVQLVFLALFIFVAIRVSEVSKPNPPWLDDPDYLPLINEALTPFINGESAKTLADLLKELFEHDAGQETLAKLLDFLRLNEKPLETLEACVRNPSVCNSVIARCNASPKSCEVLAAMPPKDFAGIVKGAGKPHCAMNNRILFTLTSNRSSDGLNFQISDVSPEAEDALSTVGVQIANNTQLSPLEFSARFLPLTKKECQHTIRYVDKVNSLDAYKTVNSYFFLSSP